MRSRIVDSTPIVVGPPSMTRSISAVEIAQARVAALVGLGREKRFALGAATGMPAAAISACAIGCDGTRTPTVGKSGRHRCGNARLLLKNQRQRAGPERPREFARELPERASRHARRAARRPRDARSWDRSTAVPWPRKIRATAPFVERVARPARRPFPSETRPDRLAQHGGRFGDQLRRRDRSDRS